jgi:hypothetical protein
MTAYTRPILTGVFYALGSIFGAVAIFLIIFGMDQKQRENIVLGVGILMSALVQFGIGQAVDFLGRSAHFSEETARMLQSQRTAANATSTGSHYRGT